MLPYEIFKYFGYYCENWNERFIKHLCPPNSKKTKDSMKCFLSYANFKISNFKSIESLDLAVSKEKLILLLGLNESGKTTILNAIEHFDFRNDPANKTEQSTMFENMKNMAAPTSSKTVKITATINIESDIDFHTIWNMIHDLESEDAKKVSRDEVEHFVCQLNKNKQFEVSRVIPFKDGVYQKYRYEFDKKSLKSMNIPPSMAKNSILGFCAHYIVSLCPYIIYFEDFKDLIPHKIYVNKKDNAFNQSWFDIIEGLFYDTDETVGISDYLNFCRAKADKSREASTIINRVNDNLHRQFTAEWKRISGVKAIKHVLLKYNEKKKYFYIEIQDNSSAAYHIADRSRGATWYIGFLMKTKFCHKKMRADVGSLVYLIDEPASNLHSSAQERMLEDFSELSKQSSVIYTTHSQYLVSLNNIKTTYVVKKHKGRLSCERVGKFISKHASTSAYYKPIADTLDIRPNVLDMAWKNALIVEGPSDRVIIYNMYKMAMDSEPNFAIYPAGGATNMSTLIALNIGWDTKHKILLDSDEAGISAKKKYQEKFDLNDSYFVDFSNYGKEIEDLFNKEELCDLYQSICNESIDNPSKDNIYMIFSRICHDPNLFKSARKTISDDTIKKFKCLFEHLSDFTE